ncbi:MAG: ATP-binding cassette domain-containing protein [Lunatimonas sp.]|uniref:ABC transporter ATP-binding protein n=1 Tax=Lunatimonas sp. TaxID=2060141 RepID=UPI00263B0B24|nr:ATP-binding cassette domain-containing protein [Lunatimonas sp.]MCC5939009.1 ATP-binding cassette domain-containing protein [Lunatimonas sp.]
MLELKLEQAGKRFQYEWIFKNLTVTLTPGQKLAVTGSNGSGKSTLIKCLAGQMPLSTGAIHYLVGGTPVSSAEIYQHITLSAPYLELPEEFTLAEFLQFHFRFKTLSPGMTIREAVRIMYLEKSMDKAIRNFSSGMKQRLKLGICFFSSSPFLLLDEPTSNLDERGVSWYHELVETYGGNKTIVVGSNDPREFTFCSEQLSIENFK